MPGLFPPIRAGRERRDAIKDIVDKRYGTKDCAQYIDMKELLARKDVDAILTATGDRWHAGVSILSMRAGKDVYTEKPASMTVREGQAVVATAAKYKRVYQAGMQRLSEPNFVVCNELVRLGRLGEVKTIYAHLAPGGNVNRAREWLPAEPEPPRCAAAGTATTTSTPASSANGVRTRSRSAMTQSAWRVRRRYSIRA